MCNALSCLIGRDRKVYWKAGIDSHTVLIEHFHLKDDKPVMEADFVRLESTPKEGYLYPEKGWNPPKIDQAYTPRWWSDKMLTLIEPAREAWQNEVYSKINLEEARNPVKPREIEPVFDDTALGELREWASVRDSVWASVWDSVCAYIGSLFPGVKEWKYTEKVKGIPKGEYPFRSAVSLWKKGLVPAYDGKQWYLLHPVEHGKAKIVWKGTP